MSLSDDKKSVFDTIGAYTSLSQENNTSIESNNLLSLNNNKEPIPYLLDVLKTIAGVEGLKLLIGGLLSTFIDKNEITFKNILKKQFTQYNSDSSLPNSFNSGINVSAKSIDTNNKFKVDPYSRNGNLLYDNNKPNFDSVAHEAILNAGQDVDFNNLSIKYDKTTDNFIFKSNSTGTISSWFTDYIDNSEILNKKELTSTILDNIFGTISSTTDKTLEEFKKELENDKIIEQLINGGDSQLSDDTILSLSNVADNMKSGVTPYDLGCSVANMSILYESLNNAVSIISGSTNSNEISNALLSVVDDIPLSNGSSSDDNKNTIIDNYLSRLIKIFTVKVGGALITAPQIRALMAISNAFQKNGETAITTFKDDVNNNIIIIKCIINELIKLLGEFMYKLALSFLIKLLKPVIKKIIKEKTNQYKRIIKSLVNI